LYLKVEKIEKNKAFYEKMIRRNKILSIIAMALAPIKTVRKTLELAREEKEGGKDIAKLIKDCENYLTKKDIQIMCLEDNVPPEVLILYNQYFGTEGFKELSTEYGEIIKLRNLIFGD
jgi:hypothetical protein